MVRELEHMMYEQTRLAGVCLAPGKKKLRGDLMALFHYVMQGHREGKEEATSPGCSKRNFLHVEGKKSTMRVAKHWNRDSEELCSPCSWRFSEFDQTRP